MKYVIQIFLLLVILASGGFLINRIFYQTPCDSPVRYHFGLIDPQFNLSASELLQDTESAAQVWERAWGKKLFVYDSKGDLTINLVYDERAGLDNKVNQLQDTLKSEKGELNPQIAEYKKLSAAFEVKLKVLNDEISHWNSQGGAPPDVFAKLTEEQQKMKAEAASLNEMAQKLNQSTKDYNSKVDQLNQTVGTLKEALHEKPEEGLYMGADNTISIYFNISPKELTHTLAHEMGHALGLGHVNDPKAVMYSYSTEIVTTTLSDKAALQTLCQKPNFLLAQSIALRFQLFLKVLTASFSPPH